MNFPTCEQDVINLYRKHQSDLDWHVIHIQRAFPDAILQNGEGQRIRAEFEFRSKNFKKHGHNPLGCDVIICWEDDWREKAPVPVWELRKLYFESATKFGGAFSGSDNRGEEKGESMNEEERGQYRHARLNLFMSRIRAYINKTWPAVRGLKISVLCSHRVGGLVIDAGEKTDEVFQQIRRNDCGQVRNYFPWPSVHVPPFCYREGHSFVLGQNWPEGAREHAVYLADLLKEHKLDLVGKLDISSSWLIGESVDGLPVTGKFSDKCPHWLISGSSGSGKSVCLLNMALQLIGKDGGQAILVDGKSGSSLRRIEHLPGVIGPCAATHEDALTAISYAVACMERRYATPVQRDWPWLFVFCDEFQELTRDPDFAAALAKLTSQGRGAKVGVVMSTQHVGLEMFGKKQKATRRNSVGRIAHYLPDSSASLCAMGISDPSATSLTGAGDAFVVFHGDAVRTQGCLATDSDIPSLTEPTWEVKGWDYDSLYADEDVAQALPEAVAVMTPKALQTAFTPPKRKGGNLKELRPSELGAALLCAARGDGRPAFKNLITNAGEKAPGSSRASHVMGLGKDVIQWMSTQGFLTEFAESLSDCLLSKEEKEKTPTSSSVSQRSVSQGDGEDENEN